jgi:hypothetical protein
LGWKRGQCGMIMADMCCVAVQDLAHLD